MREHLHHFKKVGTIAVLVDSPDDEWVRVGFSILHEGDQFNRKLGRVIAVGRAQAQREHLAAASTQEHIRDLIQTLREVGGPRPQPAGAQGRDPRLAGGLGCI